jgi:biofilm PGA synthesis N-glycosyltransferase PgaC
VIPALVLVLLWACAAAFGAASLYLLLKGACRARRERLSATPEEPTFLLKSRLVPEVAILAAPPDASQRSFEFVRRLAKLYFGHLEIVLVLDGPSSDQLKVWIREFHLVQIPRHEDHTLRTEPLFGIYKSLDPLPLIVVEKEWGGEGDCFNAAINVTSAPVIGLVDWNADISEDALLRLICPMIDEPERIHAVCAVAPASPGRGRAARLYHLDFLRDWLCRCAGLSIWNSFLPAPGSFLLLKRSAVVRAGGFKSIPGSALEMVMRLHRLAIEKGRAYQVRLIAGPFSRPAAPRSNQELDERMAREQWAIAAALSRHFGMLFGSGLAVPSLFCSRLFLPLLETVLQGLAVPALLLSWIPALDLALLIAAAAVAGILISMTAVVLEPFAAGSRIPPRELAALFFTSIVENLGHRQLRNIKLIVHFLRGFFAAPSEAN